MINMEINPLIATILIGNISLAISIVLEIEEDQSLELPIKAQRKGRALTAWKGDELPG